MKHSIVLAAAAAGAVTLASGCASPTAMTPTPIQIHAPSAIRSDALSVTPLNAPSSVFPGVTSTELTGIRGNLITATVTVAGGVTDGGIRFRRQNAWIVLNYPNASSTAIYGPQMLQDGKNYRVVGSYKNAGQAGDNGFIYDSATKTFATINAPANLCAPKKCNYTIAHSVSGKARYFVVGNYDAVSKPDLLRADAAPVSGHAFLYDSKLGAMATIDVPKAASTTAYGIWVDATTIAVAGGYANAKGAHAYVRDFGTPGHFITYDYPGALTTHFEGITGNGAPGNYNLVGDYTVKGGGVYGFFLEVNGWKVGPVATIGKLSANSVFERTVVGVYKPNGQESGYITTVPILDPPAASSLR